MENVLPFAVFLTCYIIGSFPTAYVIGRINHINIFETGSGNMGANNVTRSLGFKWGALVLALDSLKGILAVVVARLIMHSDEVAAAVIGAIAVVIGHNWSVLASLITRQVRGGKGASTALGTVLMMAPFQVILAIFGVCAAVVLVTRYVSLGVLLGVLVGTIWMLVLISQQAGNVPALYAVYSIAVAAMIYIRHWKNIVSLLAGRERRLGERAS